MSFFSELHDITAWLDPGTHYALDAAHDSSTKLVNETSRSIENIFGKDTALGGLGEHWKNMSQKDKDDFERWLTNTGKTAAAVYSGMNAAEGATGVGSGTTYTEVGGNTVGGTAGNGLAWSGGADAAGNAVGAGSTGAQGVGMAAGSGGSYYGDAAKTATGLYQEYLQSKAASDAAGLQSDAANAATAEQRRQFDITQNNQQPYIKAGGAAVTKLADLLGIGPGSGAADYGSLTKRFTGDSVATDPGYQFGLDQSLKAARNNAAATGSLYSGATLKAIPQYASDYATTKFNDAFNRNQVENNSIFNKYSGVAGTGQTSTAQLGQLGAYTAGQIGKNMIEAGDAQATNALAQGNLRGNAIGQIGSYAGSMKWPSFGGNSNSFSSSNVGGLGAGGSPDGYWADGGPVRVEPKVGTKSPLPSGGGGALSKAAVAAALSYEPKKKEDETPVNRRVLPRNTADAMAEVDKYKRGGAVKGPGGPKDDQVHAMLSNGEHVVDAASVTALGGGDNELGQMRMNRLRKALKEYGRAA
jgi:hypothetical protein